MNRLARRLLILMATAFLLALPAAAVAEAAEAPTAARLTLSRMWMGGDSMAYQIRPTLEARVRALGVSAVPWLCKSSSGIVRTDFFNWPAKLPAVLAAARPRAVVFMIGTNDGQAVTVTEGGARHVYQFGSTDWKRVYRARVNRMMNTMLASGARRVYWIGMPIMRNAAFGKKMAVLNSIFKARAAAHPGVVYVDAWRLFSSSSGAYVAAWRSSDGIHFNMAGVKRLVNRVVTLLERDF